MKKLFGFVAALAISGCCTAYKQALCTLSTSSGSVATHYSEYVNAEADADRKAARQAEASQFQQAIDEGKKVCQQ